MEALMTASQMAYGVPMISFAGDGFRVPNSVEFILDKKQHGFSDVHYEVSDVNKIIFLQADGSYMTHYRKIVMRNSAGFPILTIREKAITGQKWLVLGGESSERSQPLCTVQRSCFAPMKTRLDVFLPGKIDEDISEFQYVYTGYFPVLLSVQVNHNSTRRSFCQGRKENFGVKVRSGVDYAFILALIITVLECFSEFRSLSS
ncbi:LURP-one-related 14-like protein isoform 1 [Theobroma cacao]|uniref:LURP-one-related 14-like protein isoform 1 n=1 Tax=Theobroma cacao TaxID=3641 RepID=A0A061FL47_THECC|nr:LURP-one-related 14-like protein isoform 1 [Theobroma cacao]